MPLIPIVVVPTTSIVYHYTRQYYQHVLVLPTPQRVREMYDYIESIVQQWWHRFIGGHRRSYYYYRNKDTISSSFSSSSSMTDPEYARIVRTRKRTALAVSIATNHVLKQSQQKPAVASSM
jgi:hypothetical protein